MASLDVKRPAAQEQLAILGRQVGVDTLEIVAGQTPLQITRRAMEAARFEGYDVVLLDTAGRTHIDEPLMQEMADIKSYASPHEILLVADALTGQDAVNLAKNFDARVGITGIVLTRMDGDGRGGAALSMRFVTGKPIKLIATGEKMDALDEFAPKRIADRILGMGDIVALVEKAAATIDAQEAERAAQRMRQGQIRSARPLRSARHGGKNGRDWRHHGALARRRQDEGANRRRQYRREGDQAPARHHLVDDAQGAAQPRHIESLAQAPHRGGLWGQGRGGQQAVEAASRHGRYDEADGRRQAGGLMGKAAR